MRSSDRGRPKPRVADAGPVGAACRQAGIEPGTLAPPLERAIAQWLEVLPLAAIVHALRLAKGSQEPLHTFRQAALTALQKGQAKGSQGTVAGALHQAAAGTARPMARDIPEKDRQALLRQDRLESMSDAEYQEVLLERLLASRGAPPAT